MNCSLLIRLLLTWAVEKKLKFKEQIYSKWPIKFPLLKMVGLF